jgi:hypothetical protein
MIQGNVVRFVRSRRGPVVEYVYQLWHVIEHEDRDDDVKIIGFYRTEEDGHAAIERVRKLPGFRDSPDGFLLGKSELWEEGFVTAVNTPEGTINFENE